MSAIPTTPTVIRHNFCYFKGAKLIHIDFWSGPNRLSWKTKLYETLQRNLGLLYQPGLENTF